MEISYLLARLFGFVMTVLYGGLLLNRRYYRQLWQNISKHPFSLLLGGFLALLIGLIVVQVHPIWTADWRSLITLLGWFMTLSGTARILFPEAVLKLSNTLIESRFPYIDVISGVMLLIGLFLAYMGFSLR